MFKATYPWAKAEEERSEREYIKSLSTTASDEVAGNVWITESAGTCNLRSEMGTDAKRSIALELAKDYGIAAWIVALLDPMAIQADEKKAISPPPKYKFTSNEQTFLPPPTSTPGRGRGRPRATSPTKKDKMTSPRKRMTKAAKEANATTARQASESLQAALDAASVAESESVEPPSINGETPASPPKKASKKHAKDDDDKVKVKVQSAVEKDGDIETTHTTVSVQMPPGSPELPLPETTEEMVAKAKEMVEEAKKLEGESSKSSSKRKAEALDDEDDTDGLLNGAAAQPAKKTKLMEQEVRKQQVRNRALMGVAASLAIGYVCEAFAVPFDTNIGAALSFPTFWVAKPRLSRYTDRMGKGKGGPLIKAGYEVGQPRLIFRSL